jgi:vacuolar-type H+-ATPase subunit H
MVDQPSLIDLSPLDQIRQTEAEVTRQIAAARKSAEQIVDDARRQAASLKREAWDVGTQEGQALYNTSLSKAEEEARELIAEAQDQAKKLRRRGKERMQMAVSQAVHFVINLAEETKDI